MNDSEGQPLLMKLDSLDNRGDPFSSYTPEFINSTLITSKHHVGKGYRPRTKWDRSRYYVHLILHHHDYKYSKIAEWTILAVIGINVTAFILNTIPWMDHGWIAILFDVIEVASVVIFTIEYLLRFWSVADRKRNRGSAWTRWTGRLKFMLEPMSLIDVASIVPYYVSLIIGDHGTRFSTALRIFRAFRLFKAEKYSSSFSIIGAAVWKNADILMAAAFAMFVILVIQATLLWYIMRDSDPVNFESIPMTMWYSALQITGMGGYEPTEIHYTPWAKALAVFTAIISLAVFAVPVGVIADGFIDIYAEKKRVQHEKPETASCPSCGHHFVITENEDENTNT